jgi:hypothetical protein
MCFLFSEVSYAGYLVRIAYSARDQWRNRHNLFGRQWTRNLFEESFLNKVSDARTKILSFERTVPIPEGFYFYRDIGDYTGAVALSLRDFLEQLRTIDESSIEFHFHRQDFQKWTKDVIGDDVLSQRIGEIRKLAHTPGELRTKITKLVENRLAELPRERALLD